MYQYYWMLYVEGGESPKIQHPNKESAITEAKRLAKITGKKVTVLESILFVELNEFKITEPDLPF